MITVKQFTFNDFQENTYILSDPSLETIIIDPGCNTGEEMQLVEDYIKNKNLKPVKLINTHCHIDHVLGNSFIAKTFGLELAVHPAEVELLEAVESYSKLYRIQYDKSPVPSIFLEEDQKIRFGNSILKILFVPGHSPGHLAFLDSEQKFIIGGDVLFQGSIGRTDLPGGNYETLIRSIRTKFIPLGDEHTVYPGHGPSTNIGFEKIHNPFLTN